MTKPYGYHKRAKKAAKRYRKKTYKRRRTTSNINRSLQPFSQRYITKLKYSGNFTVPVTANIPYQFNLNSIFDPDLTGTGHQPYGHDTLATLYNRYRVYAVKWSIRIQSSDAANYYVVAVPTNDTWVVTSFDDAREKPRAKYRLQYTTASPAPLNGRVSLPSLTGRTKTQYMSDDRYQAPFGSSPQEQMVLNVYAYNAGLLTANPAAKCTIELVYYVECFDPNILSQS